MLNSLMPELGQARGVRSGRMELLFLVVVALATSMTLPVVGALLIFSLMIGPPAAARSLSSNPVRALLASVGLAVATVWIAIAASYETNWPVGFFVGVLGACCYAAGRLWASLHGRRVARPAMSAP
jgi:zinc/manganese transport system permease protein